jgi:hypothetical protein
VLVRPAPDGAVTISTPLGPFFGPGELAHVLETTSRPAIPAETIAPGQDVTASVRRYLGAAPAIADAMLPADLREAQAVPADPGPESLSHASGSQRPGHTRRRVKYNSGHVSETAPPPGDVVIYDTGNEAS